MCVRTVVTETDYGQARFETPAREVTDFLRQIVPDGQESGHIDAELNDLLRQAS
jgi:hypothetical protein